LKKAVGWVLIKTYSEISWEKSQLTHEKYYKISDLDDVNIQTRHYLLYDYGHRLNKHRIYINPNTTVKEAKEDFYDD
jgi:hypothetical protein